MAKSQKRSNREIRKPKAAKPKALTALEILVVELEVEDREILDHAFLAHRLGDRNDTAVVRCETGQRDHLAL